MLNNTTEILAPLKTTFKPNIFAGCLFLAIGIMGIGGAIAILPPIIKTPDLVSLPAYRLMVSITISGLSVVPMLFVKTATMFAGRQLLSDEVSRYMVATTLYHVYTWHMVVLAVNRFVVVIFPLKKEMFFSISKTNKYIAVLWIVWTMPHIIYWMPNGLVFLYKAGSCVTFIDFERSNPFWLGFFYWYDKFTTYPIVFGLFVMYTKIMLVLREKRKRLAREQISSQEVHLTTQFFIQYVLFVFVSLFWDVFAYIEALDQYIMGCASAFTKNILFVGEPIIYLLVNKKLRDTTLKMYGLKKTNIIGEMQ